MNDNKRIIAAGLVGFIVFTAPLFVITPITALIIAAYCTSLIAVAAVCYALYLALNRKSGMFVTTAALLLIVWSYAVLNLIYSGVVLLLYFTGCWNMPVGWFIVGHIVLAGLTAWKLLAADAGKEEIERIEVEVHQKTFDWKELRMQINAIAARADKSVKKDLESVCDAIRYADPVTSAELDDIESDIKNNVNILSEAVNENDKSEITKLTQDLLQQIRQRSEICKMLK